ncbi:putative Transcription regulator (putative) [Apilactobacillus kunkeei]|uniref:MarR family winged helix-turn-helix transcriptional regulator n=1 Tax=Apilactobacillus kunkeei TaxID=148814 RepID=UPI0006C1B250|nr:MarR family transcriptional regulator [Apilactobacillus kunkeei]KOY72822.1 putative Transcription regulator (putative) [Apilactobacillus kunkeei]
MDKRNYQEEIVTGKLTEFEIVNRIYDDIFKQSKNSQKITTQGQGKILLLLSQENRLREKEIAKELDMSPQSVGEFVNKLQKKNMVEIFRSEKDKRIKLVSITSTGLSALDSIDEDIPNFVKVLSDKDLENLEQIYSKMIDSMYDSINENSSNIINKIHKFFANKYKKEFHGDK